MLKIVVLSLAVGLASAQNFKQTQSFPSPFGQRDTQSEFQIQQQNLAAAARASDFDEFREPVAQSLRGGSLDRNIPTELQRQPLIRQPHITQPRPRPQRLRQQDRFEDDEFEENIPVRPILRPAPIRTRADQEDEENDKYTRKQAESAHYSFDSSIQDTINDNAITRSETRNGLALQGMYSYSDGFFKRTVHYEADENGYRVSKEEIEPIGDGPQYNPRGRADVSSSLIGGYSITTDDIRDTRVKDPLRQQGFANDFRSNSEPNRHRFEAGRL